MSTLKIQAPPTPVGVLPEMPVDPSWIKEGRPEARRTILCQTDDRKVSSGFWECSEGRFEWRFFWDEFVHILEGQVKITSYGGSSYTLDPGDTAHFPLGLKTEWHVIRRVRKFFVIRTPEPLTL